MLMKYPHGEVLVAGIYRNKCTGRITWTISFNCRGELEFYESVHSSSGRAEGEEYGTSGHAYISGLRVKETR